MSSFSSNKEIATKFALNVDSYLSASSVVFKLTNNKSGVSIKNLSSIVEEDEVLVKKGTKYKINGAVETVDHLGKKVTIIPLEEY